MDIWLAALWSGIFFSAPFKDIVEERCIIEIDETQIEHTDTNNLKEVGEIKNVVQAERDSERMTEATYRYIMNKLNKIV